MEQNNATQNTNNATVTYLYVVDNGNGNRCYESADFDDCAEFIKDAIVDDASDYDMKDMINQCYGRVWIGDYCYDAGDVADAMCDLEEMFFNMISDDIENSISEPDIGTSTEYSGYIVTGVIAINDTIIEPTTDNPYPETPNDEMIVEVGEETYKVTINDAGEYHAEIVQAEPVDNRAFSIRTIRLVGVNCELDTIGYPGLDDMHNALIEYVKNGWVMIGNIASDDNNVIATVIKG